MAKKPAQKLPNKHKARELTPPEEHRDDTFAVYRVGCFFVLYDRENRIASMADLNEKTIIYHRGDAPEVAVEIASRLVDLRVGGRAVYADSFAEMTDAEFMELGTLLLGNFMESFRPLADEDMMDDIFESGRASLLDELIKPPKSRRPNKDE